jgi:hypothetical protein
MSVEKEGQQGAVGASAGRGTVWGVGKGLGYQVSIDLVAIG